MAFLSVHGTRVRIREEGRGRPGTPVLLVHGAGASSAVWIPTVQRLARARHVVAMDLPGHGRSAGAARSFDELLQAVGLTAAALSIPRAVLVGHSLGGLLVLAAALSWPDKVAAIALVCSAARFSLSPRLVRTLRDDFAHFPELLEELGYAPATPRDVRRRSAILATQTDKAQTQADYAACLDFDATPRLSEIAAPALVVSGADDRLCPPAWTEALAQGIPGARRLHLQRCGHFPMHEKPDLFHDGLSAFVEGA